MQKNNSKPKDLLFCGAADGSRTHLSSLGSLHSTDELQPHKRMTQGTDLASFLVQKKGLEPSPTHADMNLNHTRLPIPPLLHIQFLSSKFYTARTSEVERFA